MLGQAPGASSGALGAPRRKLRGGSESTRRAAIVAAARTQLGVREQGGKDRGVGKYSRAVLGKENVAPWCAYFVSWAYQQAGVKLGPNGKGDGAVATLSAWAKSKGRFTPRGSKPEPGDLVVIRGSAHIGMVESVGRDGRIHTIEGNASNAVRRRTYSPDAPQITGYIRAI